MHYVYMYIYTMCIYIYNTLSKRLHQVRTDKGSSCSLVMNKDLAPIFTTIRKIRQHDTVQALRRASSDSIATCVSAASFHCPEGSPTKVLCSWFCSWIYQLVFQGKSWFLIAPFHADGPLGWMLTLFLPNTLGQISGMGWAWLSDPSQDTVTSGWRSSGINSYPKNSKQITK